ncbi:hypothetical protein J6590_010221 [Homalodisca vitripennis]|nr:hypothetical protein J6590_010221 [Homalodisca vitripennis]
MTIGARMELAFTHTQQLNALSPELSICAEPDNTLHYPGETPSMSAKALQGETPLMSTKALQGTVTTKSFISHNIRAQHDDNTPQYPGKTPSLSAVTLQGTVARKSFLH